MRQPAGNEHDASPHRLSQTDAGHLQGHNDIAWTYLNLTTFHLHDVLGASIAPYKEQALILLELLK